MGSSFDRQTGINQFQDSGTRQELQRHRHKASRGLPNLNAAYEDLYTHQNTHGRFERKLHAKTW